MAPVLSSKPEAIRARGPTRGSATVDTVEVTRMPPTNGRNSSPEVTGPVSLNFLQVVGQEQEDTEERDPGQAEHGIGAAPGPVEDHPQRQQRVRGPPLGGHERGQP